MKRVLPIQEKDPKTYEGHFSDVWKVKIHIDHQKMISNEDVHFAIKKLRAIASDEDLDKAWTREAEALEQARNIEDDHLISPIAALKRYKMDNDKRHYSYYFIFEWAKMGTLGNYWEETQPNLNAGLIMDVLTQLHGLAGALKKLHNLDTSNQPNSEGENDVPNWRHGDLKPDNILRFGDVEKHEEKLGTLRISDLGLAKRHIKETAFRQGPTTQKFGTHMYEAPETTSSKDTPRPRRYDVWSMGCIILEFIIWLLHGNKGIEKFHAAKIDGQDTLFYETMICGRKRVSHIALSWMKALRKDCECEKGTALYCLLKLVREKLLIVELDRDKPKHRIDSADLWKALDEIKRNSNKFSGRDRTNVQVPDPVTLSFPERIQSSIYHFVSFLAKYIPWGKWGAAAS